jgi:transcription-repair coupling factor (superfamily II helicase)
VRKIVDQTKSYSDPGLQALIDRIGRGESPIHIHGLHGSAKAFVLSYLACTIHRTFIVVTSTVEEARNIHRDLSCFLGDDDVLLFPPWDSVSVDILSSQRDRTAQRMDVFFRLLFKNPSVTVVPIEAFLQKVVPAPVLGDFIETLSMGDYIDREQLVHKLIEGGYRRVPLVEQKDEFSVRGHIVDIYPPTAPKPLRMEFIGDELESIREFDPVSQRSKTEVLEFVLTPASELILTDDARKRALKNVRNRANDLGLPRAKRDRLIDLIDNGLTSSINPYFLSLFYRDYGDSEDAPPSDGLETLFEYLPAGAICVFDDLKALQQAEERVFNEIDRIIHRARDEGKFYLERESFYTSLQDLRDKSGRGQTLCLEGLQITADGGESGPVMTFPFETNVGLRQEKASFLQRENGILTPLVTRMKAWIDEGYLVLFLCGEEEVHRMSHLLEGYSLAAIHTESSVFSLLNEHSDQGRLVLAAGSIGAGFSYPPLKLVIISEEEIFGRKVKRKRRTSAREGFFLKSFGELTEGDFVVHEDHGIGRYQGLLKLVVDTIENDFLLIEYGGGDKLYIPVDHLDQIQRYIGPDGYAPGVDKLGGTSWEKVKKRVKKSVQAIAQELISIYATREVMQGQQYSDLDRYYEEFSSSFEYEETPDQAKAIEDVNFDLSDAKPMDRLVCGDAGFGKTEVAVRASFRVAMEGKQVAVLVPTTILAEQHYQTFLERFKRYPVRIEVLNRYKTKAQQRDIVDDINKGRVDIVIGTQRILQKDVVFKDLGLVIIDEEQRFGVKDKERLKKLRTLVDVLTLTATPIPRTLQLSLVGIRDLSIIDTPPEDRQFIRVYVSEFDEDVVKDAVRQELARGGQLFFVHDRVKSIYSMARFLEKLIPEAQIGVAHGQMKARELEEVMVKFVKKEYNTLLCTTIIGSGVDIPTANTIIINRADRFGLSQLYQLRGRVGRSKEDAAAYLLVPKGAMLSRDAQKRLRIIQEFSDPGSGFKVAMNDLEIRGAGNFLGISQSGHVSAVGYELYTELMENAVKELKGEEIVQREIRPEINFGLSAFIPDNYITDVHVRLMTYKKMSITGSDEELSDIREELIDCYGAIPPEVDNLLEVIRIRNRLKQIMAVKMEYDGKNMFIAFHQESPVDPIRIIELSRKKQFEGLKFTPDLKLYVPMRNLAREKVVSRADNLLTALMN